MSLMLLCFVVPAGEDGSGESRSAPKKEALTTIDSSEFSNAKTASRQLSIRLRAWHLVDADHMEERDQQSPKQTTCRAKRD
jgi:hypothetical protein